VVRYAAFSDDRVGDSVTPSEKVERGRGKASLDREQDHFFINKIPLKNEIIV